MKKKCNESSLVVFSDRSNKSNYFTIISHELLQIWSKLMFGNPC